MPYTPQTWADKDSRYPVDAARMLYIENGIVTIEGEVTTETARALAAEGTLTSKFTPTAVKTASYAAAVNDYVPVDTTSSAVTVTLPAAPADGSRVGVKMVTQVSARTVTIAAGGSDVFNKTGGTTSLTLTLLNQAVILQYRATGGIWYVTSDDLALSTLDSRYVNATGGSLSALNYLIYSTGGTVYANSLDGVGASYQGSDPVTVFQNAINALKAGTGGGIQFRGQFIFASGGITMYPGISLAGVGPTAAFAPLASTIKSTYNGDVITVEMDAANNRQSFPYFQGFNLIGLPDGTCPAQNLFHFVDTPGVLLDTYLDHVMVFWAGQHGMLHDSASKTWITNCYFEDNGRAGVGDGIQQSQGWINLYDSYIHGNQGRGIFSVGTASALRARGCDFNSNVGPAIFAQAISSDFAVQSNRFAGNGSNTQPQISIRNWNMVAGADALMLFNGNSFVEDRAAGSRCVSHISMGGSPLVAEGLIVANKFKGATFSGKPVQILAATTGVNKLVVKDNQGLNDTWGTIKSPFTANSIGIDGAGTTATGVNALNSATIVVGSTGGFPASGTAYLSGVAFTYTGISGTSFTGCGNHAATTGGEIISLLQIAASTAYTVSCTDVYLVSSGGTGVSISILDPAGNTLQSGLATFAGVVPVGYAVNFGGYSVAPTVVISVV